MVQETYVDSQTVWTDQQFGQIYSTLFGDKTLSKQTSAGKPLIAKNNCVQKH